MRPVRAVCRTAGKNGAAYGAARSSARRFCHILAEIFPFRMIYSKKK